MTLSNKQSWALALLAFVAAGLLCRERIENYRPHSAAAPAPVLSESLYLVSPLEIFFLEGELDLWPRYYDAKNPLRPEELPSFYARIQRGQNFTGLAPADVEAARDWSVTISSLHPDLLMEKLFARGRAFKPRTFKEALETGYAGTYPDCSLLKRERAYRIAQALPALKKEAWAYQRKCDPASVLVLWFGLEEALEKKDLPALREANEKLRQRSLQTGGRFSTWFAAAAWAAGSAALHSQMPK